MSTQEQERNNRFRRREAEQWRARRAEVMEENRSERNGRDGRFRQLMVSLTRRASSENPPRAVSSAISRPEHMCQALCYVLSSMFSVTGPLATRVHFSIQGLSSHSKVLCNIQWGGLLSWFDESIQKYYGQRWMSATRLSRPWKWSRLWRSVLHGRTAWGYKNNLFALVLHESIYRTFTGWNADGFGRWAGSRPPHQNFRKVENATRITTNVFVDWESSGSWAKADLLTSLDGSKPRQNNHSCFFHEIISKLLNIVNIFVLNYKTLQDIL